MAERLLRTHEVCLLLDMPVSTLNKRCRLGEFPGAFLPYGNRKRGWHIPVSGVRAFVKRQGSVYLEARLEVALAELEAGGEIKLDPLQFSRAS